MNSHTTAIGHLVDARAALAQLVRACYTAPPSDGLRQDLSEWMEEIHEYVDAIDALLGRSK